MITKNYKDTLASFIVAGNITLLPVKKTDGTQIYMSAAAKNFPCSTSVALSLSTSTSGIAIGTGNTAATENDYALESQITSGITLSGSIGTNRSLDANGNPYIEHTLTLENTTANDIVIREVGYYQTFYGKSVQYATSSLTSFVMMVDRTVLDTPVTIPANGVGVVRYTLKAVVNAS